MTGGKSDCGVPPRFNFAELKEEHRNQNKFAVGNKVEYNCRPGYSKVQRSTLQCMPYSRWSDAGEFCKAKSCRHPGEPENGRLVILTDLMFGATVNFICEEGYRLIGNAERKCVLEGSQVIWDKDIPYCQVIPCKPPPEIEHGTHTGTTMEEFNYGTSVTYQCNTVERGRVPFSLIGEPSIHCTSTDNINGDWSGPAPECKVVRCEQPRVDHGKQMTGYSPVYTYRASVLFECEHRYTLKGSNVLHCNENSRWDPQLPVCERKIRCPFPNIPNGRAIPGKETYEYEDKIRIECNRGYALKDKNGSIKCDRNRAWHPPLPICEPEIPRCPNPVIEHGKQVSIRETEYTVGNSVEFQCESGYILKGNKLIECQVRMGSGGEIAITLRGRRCGMVQQWD
ncbi:membrane cofactor protein-like [Emys orbicularis]|uniref:membrane cofactor protein-like n=1 Tax=Emys orbicularis TaxID=82168 RepID=UPI0031FDA37E